MLISEYYKENSQPYIKEDFIIYSTCICTILLYRDIWKPSCIGLWGYRCIVALWSMSGTWNYKQYFNISLVICRDWMTLCWAVCLLSSLQVSGWSGDQRGLSSLVSSASKPAHLLWLLSTLHALYFLCKTTWNMQKTAHKIKTAPCYEHNCTLKKEYSLSDLLIPAPPGSIWLLLAALIRFERINPGGLFSSYRHMRTRQLDIKCWTDRKRKAVLGLRWDSLMNSWFSRRTHMSNRFCNKQKLMNWFDEG